MTDKNQTGTTEGAGIVQKDQFRIKIIVIVCIGIVLFFLIGWFKYASWVNTQGVTRAEQSLPLSGFWKRTNVSYPADQAPIVDVRFTVDDGRPCMQTSYTLNNGSRISGAGCSNDGRTFYVKENGFDVVYRFESDSSGTGVYNNTRGGTDNFEMTRL